jgi:uncharacterized membrane protein
MHNRFATNGKLWPAIYSILSIVIALVSWRFLVLGLADAFLHMAHQLVANKTSFIAHVVAGPLALFAAPFQFSGRLRTARPYLHRAIGRIYCLSVLVGGMSGFVIAFTSDNLATNSGFALLAIFWLWTTYNAYRKARARAFIEHRAWMIRSAALTFAAVTLRLWLPALQFGGGMGFETVYQIVAWLCWVPNLIIAEISIRLHKLAAVKYEPN